MPEVRGRDSGGEIKRSYFSHFGESCGERLGHRAVYTEYSGIDKM